ncbi:FAD-dependent monooxygenase [Streptomyces sp. NPDC092370]|uniref:FAD-dependent monooxygenase n=1 Tax=Streptomyces sp. NPDC092370 TaxID=3366016 RepID=UPI0038173F18
MRTHVAVIGGGPVGMLVASELAAYGVDTVLLESEAGVSGRPKATTLHARAVQCLARRGHLPGPAAPYARAAAGRPFHFAGLPGLVITAPAREPEPILKCPQAELERHFETRARAAGARILRGYRVTDVVEEDGGVRIEAAGPHRVPLLCLARYVVGADGARSTVRARAGITSDTRPATVSALMGAVTLTDPDALSEGWQRTPRGWITARRDPEGRTHIRTLNCTGAHPDRFAPPTLEELRREVSWIAGRDIAMQDPRWLGRFSDFTRLARTFRAGGIFLAGDAAHVHFPIGGQGLSTGVLDALNLGWKLALAVHGAAGAGLLDTYDPERRPVAQRVIDNTQAQLALMRPGPELDALRTLFSDLMAADREGGQHLGNMISAQDTVLSDHTAGPGPTGTFLRNVALTTATGETDVITLLQEGKPLLLLFGEKDSGHRDEARAWGGTLKVVRARAVADVPYEAVVVRPDGYLAWASGGGGLGEALSVYFAKDVRAGVPHQAPGPPDQPAVPRLSGTSASARASAAFSASA